MSSLQEEINRKFLEELDRKELMIDDVVEKYKKDREKQSELRNRARVGKMEFSYIDKPSESRFSLAPLFSDVHNIEFRSIEKTSFGNYIFMKYLSNDPEIGSKACFEYPDLKLVVDAISLLLEIKSKKVPIQKSGFRDWNLAEDAIKKYPELHKKYLRTKNIIIENFESIQDLMMFGPNGFSLRPGLLKYDQDADKEINIYDKNIFGLILVMLRSQTLYVDSNYDLYVPNLRCEKMDKNFVVMFISLQIGDNGYHANMIIIDKKNKTMERYEPHGPNVNIYNAKNVDAVLKTFATSLGLKYLGPDDFCISGMQKVIEPETIKKYYFEGFCKTWSFLYAMLRIIYSSDMDLTEFNENLRDLTLHFAKEYYEAKQNKTIESENYDLVIELLYDFLPFVLENGKQDIEYINNNLGTQLKLDGRMVYSLT